MSNNTDIIKIRKKPFYFTYKLNSIYQILLFIRFFEMDFYIQYTENDFEKLQVFYKFLTKDNEQYITHTFFREVVNGE